MRNNVIGNFSANILLFFIMIFLLMYSYRICIPAAFCAIFLCTMHGYNVAPIFVIFSILFDAYIGNILGITCCLFITLYLQTHHHQYALKNASTLYQSYCFLRLLTNVECVGMIITLIAVKHTSVGEHFFEILKTVAMFFSLKILYYVSRWWKYAKAQ